MLNKIKLIFALCGFLFVCLTSGYLGYKLHRANKTTELLNQELQKAKLEIGKAQTIITNQKISLADLSQDLQKVLKKNGELLTQYNKLVALYNSHNHGDTPVDSSDTIYLETENLIQGHLYLALSKQDLLGTTQPISYMDDKLTLKLSLTENAAEKNKLFVHAEYDLHLKFGLNLVNTIGKTGAQNTYAEIWELDKNNKPVNKLTLTSFSSVLLDNRVNEFHFWDPRLDLGISGIYSSQFSYGPDVSISLSSYGKQNDLLFRFFKFGFLFSSQNFSLDVAPISWNLASSLPLVNNLWLSPVLTYDFQKLGGGLTLSVTL
jgi:hypothetical protein